MCMSFPCRRSLPKLRGELTASVIRAARKRNKNITAPMHRTASAILITPPAYNRPKASEHPLDNSARKIGLKSS